MKFDRRIFSNLVLFVIIIVLVVVFTMRQSTTAIQVAYSDELVSVSSKDYWMKISYNDVTSVELVENPELGSVADGKNRPELQSGLWKNETWGEYQLVFNPVATNCIVVHTTDGQIFVFNCNSNEATAESYEEFLTHIR